MESVTAMLLPGFASTWNGEKNTRVASAPGGGPSGARGGAVAGGPGIGGAVAGGVSIGGAVAGGVAMGEAIAGGAVAGGAVAAGGVAGGTVAEIVLPGTALAEDGSGDSGRGRGA